MPDLIDLDAFVKPDIRVRLHEQDYRLPGDPQTDILLRITALFQALSDTDGDIDRVLELREELAEQVLYLFQERQPDLDDIRLSDEQVLELVSKLMDYYASAREEAADATRPTAPSRTKTSRSSRASSKARSVARDKSASST